MPKAKGHVEVDPALDRTARPADARQLPRYRFGGGAGPAYGQPADGTHNNAKGRIDGGRRPIPFVSCIEQTSRSRPWLVGGKTSRQKWDVPEWYSSRDPAREETPQAFLLNLRGHAIPPADASLFFYTVNERAFEAP